MQRVKQHGDGDDRHALLGRADDEDLQGSELISEGSSLQDDKPFEESERNDLRSFDDEDYITSHATQRNPSLFNRFGNALRFLCARPLLPSATDGTQYSSSKFSRTVKAIFNYPDRNMDLRSTAWLDGVRGLAAFEVFIYHYAREWVDRDPAWGPEKTAFTDPAWYKFPFIRTFYNSGHAAVAVFFAISGYVLSHRVLTLYSQNRHEQAYAALSSATFRRALRLFTPAAIWTFFVMLVCWLCDPWLPKPEPYEINPNLFGEIYYWAGKVTDMLLPINYPERWVALMNHFSGNVTWTISLEYYGSLVVYGALLFVSRTRAFAVRQALVLSMVALSLIKDDWCAAQFLLGLCFADWQIHREKQARTAPPGAMGAGRRWTARTRRIFFYSVFVFGWFLSGLPMSHMKASEVPGEDSWQIESRPFFDLVAQPLAWLGLYASKRQVDQYLYALAGLCVLVGVGETPFLKVLMEARFVQYLGKISFGFYLVHVPIRAWLGLLDPFWFGLVGSPFIPWDQREENFQLLCVWILRMGPAIVINLIAGGLFERYVDRPTIKFAKLFEQWCLSFGKQEEGIALPSYRNEPLAGPVPPTIEVHGLRQ